MKTTSKCAVIFGVMLFIIGCGTEDIPLICAAALLIGFGGQAVCELEGNKNV